MRRGDIPHVRGLPRTGDTMDLFLGSNVQKFGDDTSLCLPGYHPNFKEKMGIKML